MIYNLNITNNIKDIKLIESQEFLLEIGFPKIGVYD